MAYRPKHFKVHASIRNHAKTANLYSENDLLAMYVRLGILAIERFADRKGNTFIVHERELPSITGKKRSDSALKLLRYFVDTSPIVAEYSDHKWSITFPNLRKKQGFQVEAVSKRSPSPTPTPTPTPTKEEGAAKRPPPAPGSEGKGNKPESFTSDQMSEIRAWSEPRGFQNSTLNEAMELFREWEPLKQPRRTSKQWVAAFKKITRESVADGKIGHKTGDALKPKGKAYDDWKGFSA